jgi:hypothetical protein
MRLATSSTTDEFSLSTCSRIGLRALVFVRGRLESLIEETLAIHFEISLNPHATDYQPHDFLNSKMWQRPFVCARAGEQNECATLRLITAPGIRSLSV